MACIFKPRNDGNFTPFGVRDDDMDVNTMKQIYDKAVTITASKILGEKCHKNKSWITGINLDVCDGWRDLKQSDLKQKERKHTEKRTRP